MPDRTDHPSWPTPRGPWPEVISLHQIFDYGKRWCVNADGHPSPDDTYPDPSLHFPPFECPSTSLNIRDARDETDGEMCNLEIYAMTPYRFGEDRARQGRNETRIVFDLADDREETAARLSATPGDALRIALHLTNLVRAIDHGYDG